MERHTVINERTCIYCSQTKPESEFNREHVIPQAFGTFGNETLVLHGLVCSACNQHFGNTIDLALGRDSWEAIQRYTLGVKKAEDRQTLAVKCVKFRLDEGPYEGAHAILRGDREKGIVIDLVPQVGFLDPKTGEYNYVPTAELGPDTIPAGYARGSRAIGILARSSDDVARAHTRLDELGVGFTPEGDEPLATPDGDTIGVSMSGTINSMVTRAIAKIAFNYVAYHRGPAFVRQPAFDDARTFIRWGGGEWRQFVQPRHNAVLDPGSPDTCAHLVTAELRVPAGTPGILRCQVSLFNSIPYDVILTRTYTGLVYPLQLGHAFDPVNQTVCPLYHSSRIIRTHGL